MVRKSNCIMNRLILGIFAFAALLTSCAAPQYEKPTEGSQKGFALSNPKQIPVHLANCGYSCSEARVMIVHRSFPKLVVSTGISCWASSGAVGATYSCAFAPVASIRHNIRTIVAFLIAPPTSVV